MITFTIWKAEGRYSGFAFEGHADYSRRGSDIVCAAVSVLALNTANSIEAFTQDYFEQEHSEDGGYLKMSFPQGVHDDTSLLIDSLVLGVKSIRDEYGEEYIALIDREV